jgi:hypothetical protein
MEKSMNHEEGLVTTGGCLCGAVRYESRGEPFAQLICHCRDCQRASGTGGVPIMAVPKSAFRVTGETKSFAVEGGSGKRATRHFCARCGSLLFGAPEVAPQMITIYAGSLDDAGAFAPKYAQYTRTKAAWCSASIPEHATSPHAR